MLSKPVMPDTRLYVNTRVTRRWAREVGAGRPVMFFSPYVTGKTSHRVLRADGAGRVELYMVFSVENFASSASSLDCLRSLIAKGVTAFHLPELHAKMLLIPGRSLTVGSQNLTARGGAQNREATAMLTDPKLVKQAGDEVKRWLEDRVQITAAMLDDMKRRVPPMRKLFKAVKQQTEELNEEVFRLQRERDDREKLEKSEREAQERREAQQRERIRRLRTSVAGLRVASSSVKARMQPLVGWHSRSNSAFARALLMALGGRSLTRWRFDEEVVDLQDLYRYLCVVEQTGKLGWARVASTRISFVEPSVSHGQVLSFRGHRWSVTTDAVWEGVEETGCNLKIQLTSFSGESVEIGCWFSLGGLEVISTEWDDPPPSVLPADFSQPIAKNEEGIRTELTKLLVEPFKYRDGMKLGQRAGNLFGSVGTRYTIRLGRVDDHDILVASQWV